ncbi:hypothetical protein PR202_gb08447 [Eleusine coracana subsp. coracana]|uniref:Uncharacterized protein n=1 Tax=Eleusine coracana subsp. coracana TaxID=191504 RepID=A0AAV5EDZ0_ELECO|nr:hypothetical protein PR202_gb08447 [Eleusine coracana subsp. coracana]
MLRRISTGRRLMRSRPSSGARAAAALARGAAVRMGGEGREAYTCCIIVRVLKSIREKSKPRLSISATSSMASPKDTRIPADGGCRRDRRRKLRRRRREGFGPLVGLVACVVGTGSGSGQRSGWFPVARVAGPNVRSMLLEGL